MFRGLVFSILLLTAGSLHAQLPHTFQAGQPARAAEVNENFSALWQGVAGSVGGITVESRESSGEGIAGVQCPADTLAISANCFCSSQDGTRNFGVVFSCFISGDGGFAGCFDYPPVDLSLPPPQANIRVQCLGGQQNDGTPLVRIFGMEMKTLSDEFGDTLNALQNELNDFRVLRTP